MHKATRRLTSILGSILAKYPRLLALVLGLKVNLWRWSVAIRSKRWAQNFDANRTYWINPNKIIYALASDKLGQYDKFRDRGRVTGGNWDRKRVKFEDFGIGVYRGLEDRFIRGMLWEETEFYKRVLLAISKGLTLWGCRNKGDLDLRCCYLDSLFQDIKTNGFKAQHEIPQLQCSPYKDEDEITVRIGHDGALLFEDGQHRLAIAKILGIEKIPIKITARHSEWYRLRKEVLEYARDNGGKIYQPITHPDLSDIPSVYGDERFKLIQEHLLMESGSLLDIGSHWGYFCHRFEEVGFDCYAIESDSQAIYFLEKLKIAENRKFKIVRRSIFDYRDKTDFEVVLALNIFHHFIKTEGTFYKLVELLRRLDIKVMFFQPELPGSPQMKDTYRNFSCTEFVNFVLENSKLNHAEYIGETQDRRPLYMLNRV